jgi:hypothetical protein
MLKALEVNFKGFFVVLAVTIATIFIIRRL